ncbi:MAG: sialidase family protein, partial [candidate division WOR-3 bacterium]
MKKIILCLILIGFLRAFIDMPEGWRCRKVIFQGNASGMPVKGVWVHSKGDTIVKVFIADTGNLISTLFFTKSYDAGFSWSTPSLVDENLCFLNPSRILIDQDNYIYAATNQWMGENPWVYVYVSNDMGNTWRRKYEQSTSSTPWIATNMNKVALVFLKVVGRATYIYFTFSEDHGNTWNPCEILGEGESPRVEIHNNGDFYVFGKINNRVYLAKRNYPNWIYYPFPDANINLEEPNRIMRIDPQDPNVIHFVYSAGNETYYRKFANGSWSERIFIGEGTNSDFVVETGGKIYAIIGYNNGNYVYNLKYYTSDDGGLTWVYKGLLYEARDFCYEKNKRGRGLGLIDVGANYEGLPIYQGNDDYPVSNKEYATAYNSNKHLARIPNSDDLYMVFEMESDTNEICFTYSLDGGTTWAPYKIIGHGRAPVIHISPNPLHPGNYDISVVFAYWFPPEWERKLMYRAKRIGPDATAWSPIIHLKMPEGYTPFSNDEILYLPHLYTSCGMSFNFTAGQKFLNVVLRASDTEGILHLLHVIYEIPDNLSNITELNPLNFYVITSAPSNYLRFWFPSFGMSQNKFHVVWEDIHKIYYSETSIDGIDWTSPLLISHDNVDAYNPSIEVYGDSLYVVWSEPESNGKHDVWRRRKKVTEPYNYWPYLPQRVSSINGDDYDSRYPTNSELKFTLWNEEDHNNTGEYDPWFRYNDDPPMVFYNTAEHSYFPHGNRYLTSFHIWLYGIWTEKDHLLYRILSHKREYIPIGGESSYLSYSGGENSPYLIEREGIKDYGNIRVDIGQNLIYEFHLDTIYNYEVEAEFYFEGNGIRKGKIITSNFD